MTSNLSRDNDFLVFPPPGDLRLYQQCASLRVRLLLIRGFAHYFAIAGNGSIDSSQFADPVVHLWDLFSLGISLCYVFDLLPSERGFPRINHSEYNYLLYDSDPDREKKPAIALFAMEINSPTVLRAIPECEPFTVEEVWFRGSTHGLEKVVRSVKAIVDRLPTGAFHIPPLTPECELSPVQPFGHSTGDIIHGAPVISSYEGYKQAQVESNRIANEEALNDLIGRVHGWKGLHPESFGRLLLNTYFTTTRSNLDGARHVFLFENIILFCQEEQIRSKRFKRVPRVQTTASDVSNVTTSPTSAESPTFLRLKSRIYIGNITTVLPLQPRSLAVPGTTTKYPLTIWWNGNTTFEHITLKCHNEDQRVLWGSQITALANDCHSRIAIINAIASSSCAMPSQGKRSSDPLCTGTDGQLDCQPRSAFRKSWSDPLVRCQPTTLPRTISEPYVSARDMISEIVRCSDQRSRIISLRGEEAQSIVDFLNIVLHEDGILEGGTGKQMLRLFTKLARSANVFPRCYELKGVELEMTKPQDGGGFADIYRGKCGKQSICLKVVRSFRRQDNSKLLSAHIKELTLWAHLKHENILPFYGVYLFNDSPQRICIVSPWMQNGNLSEYLENFPEKPRLPLVSDIVSGLLYLHDSCIVHGDLKAKNVLVSDHGRALITDFGLSHVVLSTGVVTTRATLGTMRWSAPELLADDSDDYIPPTKESDIWSLGCLLHEVFDNFVAIGQ
ncbi:Serine/threonine-protein kinase HT1 [Leucoagaricus sp. SymC.cos]|nr:Serine/threonine-protein kinase HT1 [Leucoagaricus sp. SymC.cos]